MRTGSERGTTTTAPPFRIVERARWSDVDAAGIVCYGAYLRFFELAETEMLRQVGLEVPALAERHGFWLVRRRVECDFHRPVGLDDELDLSAEVLEIGTTSVELGFTARVARDGGLAAEARYVLVAVDRRGFRPLPLPRGVTDALAACRREAAVAIEPRESATGATSGS